MLHLARAYERLHWQSVHTGPDHQRRVSLCLLPNSLTQALSNGPRSKCDFVTLQILMSLALILYFGSCQRALGRHGEFARNLS
jgi:hypothetical protein